MPVTAERVDLSVLTDKQRDVAEPVVRQLRALERTSFPAERQQVVANLLVAGIALKHVTDRLEAQLATFDKALTDRGTTDAEDDLWIQNLQRLTVMLNLLSRAEAAI